MLYNLKLGFEPPNCFETRLPGLHPGMRHAAGHLVKALAASPHHAGLGGVELWEAAIVATEGAFSNVLKVDDEVAAFSVTTSGVEQTFTHAQWSHEARRSWMSSSLAENELKIIADCREPSAWPELLARARDVWTKMRYGTPRASGPGRRARKDLGTKRRAEPAAETEAGFLHKRRRLVSDAVAARPDFLPGIESRVALKRSDAADWTTGHEKEIRFVLGKRFDALVDSVMTGEVDASSLPTEVLRVVVLEEQRRRAKQRKLSSEPAPHVGPRRLAGAKVFVEPAVMAPGSPADEAVISAALLANRALRTMDRNDADFFIVSDPTKVLQNHQRTSWACGLRGGYAANVQFLCSGGGQGVCLGFRQFGATRKYIYMSAGFQANYGPLCGIIRGCAKWHELDDAGFTRMWGALGVAKRRSEFVVLVSKAEMSHPVGILAGNNRLMDEELGRVFVASISASRCKRGFLGR